MIQIRTVHNKWLAFRGDSTAAKDLLFTTKLSYLPEGKSELNVFLAANTDEEVCDFEVKGSWMRRSCTCTVHAANSDVILAQVRSNTISFFFFFCAFLGAHKYMKRIICFYLKFFHCKEAMNDECECRCTRNSTVSNFKVTCLEKTYLL